MPARSPIRTESPMDQARPRTSTAGWGPVWAGASAAWGAAESQRAREDRQIAERGKEQPAGGLARALSRDPHSEPGLAGADEGRPCEVEPARQPDDRREQA